ncbi:FAD-dependent oxidoreductase [Streptomyces sp. NBC_01497]|uniref:FAD-dependent oxidoreductase n=1 Tax=Streptomyces sp. NBC_01497 TaxID=2903885 RepID=UPI002E3024C4|nr:FAD-dependent oxidoreductase [Streptomyces sp. NBC_01497]
MNEPTRTTAKVTTTDVLIIGAGPTGLTLACDLARRGVSFLLLERSTTPSTASRAKTIQPRTMEIADDLGVAGRVLTEVSAYGFSSPVAYRRTSPGVRPLRSLARGP